MPRLPDIDSLGDRPLPRAVRPVVTYKGGVAETAFAEAHAATAASGQKLFQAGVAVAEYGQKQDKATADAALNQLATHSYKKSEEYALDEDFAAAPDKYLIDVTQFRDKLAEGIGGAAERQRLIDRSRIFIDSGLNRVKQGAWAREADTNVKALDTQLAESLVAAQKTSDEAERSGIISAAGANVRAAAERGYIDRDTADRWIAAWQQQYAEGWLNKLAPGDRRMVLEAAAEGSKGGIVSLIPEERLKQLLPEARRAADTHALDSAAEARAAAAQASRDGMANRAAEHQAAFDAAIERRGDLSPAEKAAERDRLGRVLRGNSLLGAYERAANGDPEAGRAFIERARGDGGIADAAERAAAIRALESEQGRLESRHAAEQTALKDRRGREIGQALVDGKLSRQDAYDEIGNIADPELRHFARRHLAGRFAAEDAAKRQERSGALHAAIDAMEQGTPLGDLPGEVLGKLDPPAIAILRRAAARTAKARDGAPPASDAKALARIEALIAEDPRAFARLDLAEARADLNRADFDRLARLQKLDLSSPEIALERIKLNRFAGALRAAGRDPWSADSEALRQTFADEIAAHEHIHGRKPDAGEMRKIAEGVAGEGTPSGSSRGDIIFGEDGDDELIGGGRGDLLRKILQGLSRSGKSVPKPDVKPDVKPGPKLDVKPEAKPELKLEPKPNLPAKPRLSERPGFSQASEYGAKLRRELNKRLGRDEEPKGDPIPASRFVEAFQRVLDAVNTAREVMGYKPARKAEITLSDLGDDVEPQRAIQDFVTAHVEGGLDAGNDDVRELRLGKVSPEYAARIKEATRGRFDIADLDIAIDTRQINHAFNQHGPGNELDPTQEPISPDAVSTMLDVIQNYDKKPVFRMKRSGPTITFEKRVNGSIIVVQQIRGESGTFSFFDMWIKKN